MRIHSHFTIALLLLTVSASLVAAPVERAASADTAAALTALEVAARAPVVHQTSAVSGLATFLSTSPGTAIPIGRSLQASAQFRARAFLESHGAVFGIGAVDQIILRHASTVDRLGIEHVRYRQTYGGVPVTGGELTVHLRGDSVIAVNARTVAGVADVPLTPTVAMDDAREAARSAVGGSVGDTEITLGEPRLELFNRGHLEGRRTRTRLAWFIEARAVNVRRFVWIDAQTGTPLLEFSQRANARDRQVYDANDGASLPGTLLRSESDPPTGDPDVDLAFEYSGDTWDYFWTEHGRDSYDGAGASLVSSVDYCPNATSCPYANAFWNGEQMVFGDGYPAADDVTAHEITHAFIEHTADFFYYMQSGALSESYADVFGEAVDLTNGSGNDDPAMRWLLGEDRPCADPLPGACASRSMMQPNLFGDPASLSDWRFVCEDPGDDGGGLHSNSGVPNHAFALLVDGGSFNGVTVAGMGLTKAGKIYYRALAHYLLSASNFVDHGSALRQSCQDLVGFDGITSADCLDVDRALRAVEIDQPWPCERSSATAAVLCPSAQVTSTLFADDLESGTDKWSADTITSTPVGDNVWGWGHDFATSGTSHLTGNLLPQCDPDAYGFFTDSSVEMSVDVPIPAGGAYLQFAHAFGFENYSEFEPHEYYDGGVLEYSVDGGSAWYDAGDLIVAGTTYGGQIDPGFGNPLAGRGAFVGDSWGYTSTQVDLSDLAGYSVRFRFRIGTDDTTDFCDYGWFVDDVRAFLCPASCLAMPQSGCLECTSGLVLSSGGAAETVETWVGCDSITAGADFGVGSSGRVTLIAPFTALVDGFFVAASGELTVYSDK